MGDHQQNSHLQQKTNDKPHMTVKNLEYYMERCSSLSKQLSETKKLVSKQIDEKDNYIKFLQDKSEQQKQCIAELEQANIEKDEKIAILDRNNALYINESTARYSEGLTNKVKLEELKMQLERAYKKLDQLHATPQEYFLTVKEENSFSDSVSGSCSLSDKQVPTISSTALIPSSSPEYLHDSFLESQVEPPNKRPKTKLVQGEETVFRAFESVSHAPFPLEPSGFPVAILAEHQRQNVNNEDEDDENYCVIDQADHPPQIDVANVFDDSFPKDEDEFSQDDHKRHQNDEDDDDDSDDEVDNDDPKDKDWMPPTHPQDGDSQETASSNAELEVHNQQAPQHHGKPRHKPSIKVQQKKRMKVEHKRKKSIRFRAPTKRLPVSTPDQIRQLPVTKNTKHSFSEKEDDKMFEFLFDQENLQNWPRIEWSHLVDELRKVRPVKRVATTIKNRFLSNLVMELHTKKELVTLENLDIANKWYKEASKTSKDPDFYERYTRLYALQLTTLQNSYQGSDKTNENTQKKPEVLGNVHKLKDAPKDIKRKLSCRAHEKTSRMPTLQFNTQNSLELPSTSRDISKDVLKNSKTSKNISEVYELDVVKPSVILQIQVNSSGIQTAKSPVENVSRTLKTSIDQPNVFDFNMTSGSIQQESLDFGNSKTSDRPKKSDVSKKCDESKKLETTKNPEITDNLEESEKPNPRLDALYKEHKDSKEPLSLEAYKKYRDLRFNESQDLDDITESKVQIGKPASEMKSDTISEGDLNANWTYRSTEQRTYEQKSKLKDFDTNFVSKNHRGNRTWDKRSNCNSKRPRSRSPPASRVSSRNLSNDPRLIRRNPFTIPPGRYYPSTRGGHYAPGQYKIKEENYEREEQYM